MAIIECNKSEISWKIDNNSILKDKIDHESTLVKYPRCNFYFYNNSLIPHLLPSFLNAPLSPLSPLSLISFLFKAKRILTIIQPVVNVKLIKYHQNGLRHGLKLCRFSSVKRQLLFQPATTDGRIKKWNAVATSTVISRKFRTRQPCLDIIT